PKGLESLRDGAGQEVPVLRLEPLLIGSIFPIHGEDRIVVTPQEVPALLPAALKAVEDRKFDSHHGVDPVAMLRALWVNVRARQIEQGGSTLTQQLVRSYFLSTRQTFTRKIREAIMAMALDAHFTKADLMNAYINEIFLGQDGDRAIHGFGLASQFYFGKPLAELDLSEVALLVAVVRGPSYYDPRRHAERPGAGRARARARAGAPRSPAQTPGAARGRARGHDAAERRCDRHRRRPKRGLRRLRPRARRAPLDGLAGEALRLSHRPRERPLQRRHRGAGRAHRPEARQRPSLAAGEFHSRGLRARPGGARARRVAQSRHRRRGARRRPAQGRRHAAALWPPAAAAAGAGDAARRGGGYASRGGAALQRP